MWEKLDTYTERMRVPGGWIVKSSYSHTANVKNGVAVAVTCHQVFIADIDHSWVLPAVDGAPR